MNEHRTAEEIEENVKYSSGSLKECNRCKKIVGAFVEGDGVSHCISCITFFCNKNFDTIQELQQQLHAETQRADKADEMVAAFRTFLFHSDKCFNQQMASNWEESCTCGKDSILKDSNPFEQAFRQKLCDEIVGKIEAERVHYSAQGKDALYTAANIVKSVLSDEG